MDSVLSDVSKDTQTEQKEQNTKKEFKINSVLGKVTEKEILTNITAKNEKKRNRLNDVMNIGFTKVLKVKNTDSVKVNTNSVNTDTQKVNRINIFCDSKKMIPKVKNTYGIDFDRLYKSVKTDFDKQTITNLYKKVVTKS